MSETARNRLIKATSVAKETTEKAAEHTKRAFGSRIEEAFLEAVRLLESRFANRGESSGQINAKSLAKDRDEYTTEFVTALAERLREDGLKVIIDRPQQNGTVTTVFKVSWDEPSYVRGGPDDR